MILSQVESYSKISIYILVSFFLLLLASFPLLLLNPFFSIPYANICYVTNLSVFSALAIIMVLFHKKSAEVFQLTYFSFALLLFFCVTVAQFFFFSGFTFKEFLFSIAWVIIPLAVYLYDKGFSKLILPFSVIFWVFNAYYGITALLLGKEVVGIPGNRNWHASFLIVVTSLMLFYLYRVLRKSRLSYYLIVPIFSVPLFISLVLLYKCYSRAANLALIFILILFLLMLLLQKKPKHYRRIITICGVGFICLIVLSLLLYGDKIAYQITRDIRLPLWKGAIDLFRDNFLVGVGAPSYESVYSYYTPIDRFMRGWYYSTRVDYPHNHLLYIAGSFGIFALVAYLYLWFAPIIICIKKYRFLTARTKLFLFLFIALTIHGMLDLVIFKWPTIFFAFILQGLLWKKSFPLKSQEENSCSVSNSGGFATYPLIVRILTYGTACILLFYAISMMYDNLKGSLYWRAAYIKNLEGDRASSLYFFDRSQVMNSDPLSIYQAGFSSLVFFNDYMLGLKYFSLLEKHPARIIAHMNSHIANCLIHQGRRFEALKYLKRETTVYPLSIIAFTHKMQMERALHMDKDALRTERKLLWILQFKGYTPDDLNTILEHPEMDEKYTEFNH